MQREITSRLPSFATRMIRTVTGWFRPTFDNALSDQLSLPAGHDLCKNKLQGLFVRLQGMVSKFAKGLFVTACLGLVLITHAQVQGQEE